MKQNIQQTDKELEYFGIKTTENRITNTSVYSKLGHFSPISVFFANSIGLLACCEWEMGV